MKKESKRVTAWERYLTKEIGIELKASLYFFAMLFFYCCYRICIGSFEASILHMAEMIFLIYVLEYIQTFLLWNFDESELLGAKEIFAAILCTLINVLVAILCNWFDKRTGVIVGFGFYVLFMYAVMMFMLRYRRYIDEKILNEELEAFKSRKDE